MAPLPRWELLFKKRRSPTRAGYRYSRRGHGRSRAGRGLLPAARLPNNSYLHFSQTLCPAHKGTRAPSPSPANVVHSQCPPAQGRQGDSSKDRGQKRHSWGHLGDWSHKPPKRNLFVASVSGGEGRRRRGEFIHPRDTPIRAQESTPGRARMRSGARAQPPALGCSQPLLRHLGPAPGVSLPEPSGLLPGSDSPVRVLA